MPARTRRSKSGTFPLEGLYGMDVPPEAVVRRGMVDLERELNAQFRERASFERDQSAQIARLRTSVLPSLEGNAEARAAVQRLRQTEAKFRRQKLESPQVARIEPRIFPGSIAATVTPPYSWPWTWTAGSGNPSVLSAAANQNAGTMSFNIWNSSNQASSASARAALGIFFRPMTANGILRVSSNPALSYRSGTYCVMSSCHSDAFIGLYVGEYNLSGGFNSAPVNQMTSLWSIDSWFQGTGPINGTNSGFPLLAQFNVDSAHWYALWVWCGGSASGGGWSTFWGSVGNSQVSVTVPSITWELF